MRLKAHALTISLLFGVIASIWSISSPVGSSADDDFHLTSVFCFKESKQCLRTDKPDEVLVERIIGEFPPCYVGFSEDFDRNYSKNSGKCLTESPNDFLKTNRFNQYKQYPNIYYSFVSNFINTNTIFSVYFLRFINIVIASLVIFLLLIVSPTHINLPFSRLLSTALFPVGIYFIASNNPSSWMITGLITNWAFLGSLIWNIKTGQSKLLIIGSSFGYIISGFLASVSRFDSIYYLLTLNLCSLILFVERKLVSKYFVKLLPLISIIFLLSASMFFQNSGADRVLSNLKIGNISYIPADISNDQPNSIINTLIELPSYILSIFGGQRPYWTPYSGDLPWEFAYGVGWLEFSFPSIVAILLIFSMTLLLANSVEVYTRKNLLILVSLIFSIVIFIVGWRLIKNYAPYYYFQPRYLAGFIIASFGLLLTTIKIKPLSPIQTSLIFLSSAVASVISWMSISTRYSLGPNHSLTNFWGNESWNAIEILNRPRLFVILLVCTFAFNFSIIKLNKKLIQQDSSIK